MKRRTWLAVAPSLLLLCAVLAWPQGTYKAETVSSLPPDLPSQLAVLLGSPGVRVTNASGGAFVEVWPAKNVPASSGGTGGADAVYPSLGVGTLVGVLHFVQPGSDFRGQAIKPGYYTMRYAHLPQDGNHMGVNPYPDFVLLSPASADTQAGQTLKLEDLIQLSRQASGTAHPAVMSLVPVKAGGSLPSVVQDDQGRQILQMKWSLQGQETPVALVVVGQASSQ
jgi:hypothetical protein